MHRGKAREEDCIMKDVLEDEEKERGSWQIRPFSTFLPEW